MLLVLTLLKLHNIGLDNVGNTDATTSTLAAYLNADTPAKEGKDNDAAAKNDNSTDGGNITTYNEMSLVIATDDSVSGS